MGICNFKKLVWLSWILGRQDNLSVCKFVFSPGIQTVSTHSPVCHFQVCIHDHKKKQKTKKKQQFIPVAFCLRCLKWVVLHWKPAVTVYWMTISAQFILFSVEVDPIATPAADFSLCIFDHYSFIFCGPESGAKLLHSMIYDIPSWRCMKNKLDFPTPFPDPPPPPPPTLPPFITPASLYLPRHVAHGLRNRNTEGVFTPHVLQRVCSMLFTRVLFGFF